MSNHHPCREILGITVKNKPKYIDRRFRIGNGVTHSIHGEGIVHSCTAKEDGFEYLVKFDSGYKIIPENDLTSNPKGAKYVTFTRSHRGVNIQE